ncbi:MAG: T9SS type A sorting domain-containing protein [Candidatus Kapabacteria bacterium]|nr:T9SS type A sorting domain-containing protein [Candidatus Kapabacteria bacterium]
MKYFAFIILFFTLEILKSQNPDFSNRYDLGEIKIPALDEASGIAASRKYPNVIWSHNDGAQGKIFAFDTKGSFLAEFKLNDSLIHPDSDFEDICIGPGPIDGIDYLYLGDIGDNGATRKTKFVIRFPEPFVDINNSNTITQQIKSEDLLPFSYPDITRDSETLMIDPISKDIYHVSKRETFVAVYRMSYPQEIGKTTILEKTNTLTIGKSFFDGSGVTGGDISPNGKEILLRDYSSVYYYYLNKNETIIDAFKRDPIIIPQYNLFPFIEPQGEAICWTFAGNGFFTTGEIKQKIAPHLSYFKKNSTNIENEINSSNFNIDLVDNNLVIQNCNNITKCNIQIYDNKGKVLLVDSINENNNIFSLSNLQNGTYFVSISMGNSILYTKSISIVK